MLEGMDRGLILGVCTTSNVKSAQAIAYDILKDINFEFVLAGDMVSRKKPDPEIYNMALEKMSLKAEEVVVIEDSRNGVLAANGANLYIVATTNVYTEKEDLSDADIIITSLGDPEGEKGILIKGGDRLLNYDGILHVEQVVDFLSE
jgi:beta-phosphoglucomutase-like phosphatase (HAD superfamily)